MVIARAGVSESVPPHVVLIESEIITTQRGNIEFLSTPELSL